ncbi:MAG: aminopeptidase N [Deltaproteobacteria bacterium]|nr:aminopeptidase N [Deltaproteobacteria bacterium]
MTATNKHKRILLSDYQPAPYHIFHTELTFSIFEQMTEVKATLHIRKNSRAAPGENNKLSLNGSGLNMTSILINGVPAASESYHQEDDILTIYSPGDELLLETRCQINPEKNLSLEGLYSSCGTLCTQCEAEGFRKITWYLDRPDNMATFSVRMEADKSRYPSLLSNGHCTSSGELPEGRHFATWEDPFPKPCYLFAMVAGRLSSLEDRYTTRSGRQIRLSIHARQEEISKCTYAMDCLKKAMRWDEDVFGLECDLDHYQIVAISDFNMGAMENKGLNIFNSALVLASPESTQDGAYQSILAVIGHEYFHNWTGNRVTCRDWFQLCLKEGLTVFRDQEFSADMYSRAVIRIEEVRQLQQQQWPEDDGPLSHPPRPSSYQEINNFYTATVYNKGAEVVRLLQTLIGKEHFLKGMDLYFRYFDGQAVCQEDFVQAMAEASAMNLDQFMLWYTEAGTPVVTVEEKWNPTEQTYELIFHQETRQGACPDQIMAARVIPVTLGLLSPSGEAQPFTLREHEDKNPVMETTLVLTQEQQTFHLEGMSQKPCPSLFRNFSAPVRVRSFHDHHDLAFLMRYDSDPFSVWNAAQTLYMDCLLKLSEHIRSGQQSSIPEHISTAFGSVLQNPDFDPAFRAHVLTLPSEVTIANQSALIDAQAIHQARNRLTQHLASQHQESLKNIWQQYANESFDLSAESIGRRALKNTCLHYICHSTQAEQDFALRQYRSSVNMTDKIAALRLLCQIQSEETRQAYLDESYTQWKNDPLAIDQWFALQASLPLEHPAEDIRRLMNHDAFSLDNPNRMRSVLSVFCHRNLAAFHQKDGSGYALIVKEILTLDQSNRQMAAHLCRAFQSWHKMTEPCRDLIRQQLLSIQSQEKLSSDLKEMVDNFLKI